MKIAILGIKKIPATAGADRVVEQLLPCLPQSNQYFVYLMKTDPPTMKCERNIHYIYLPALKGKHLKPFSYFLFCALHFLIKGGEYQVAHVHNSDFGLFCILLRLRRRVRIIGTFHGDPYQRTKWGFAARIFLRISERAFVRCCVALTLVSHSKVVAMMSVVSKPISYIPNGIDTTHNDEHTASLDLGEFGVDRYGYLMFACGRLDSTKGLHHLLAAYKEGNFTEKLLVVGDFTHDPGYARKIEQMRGSDSRIILFEKLVPKPVLLELIRNCRLFVFPSEVEAMSMMLLEAISCKKTVVCSDIPENLGIVGLGYKYAFSLSTPSDLLDKLETALMDVHAGLVADQLYYHCEKQFDWHTIAAQYAGLYCSPS